ncbi:DUF6907 domain-containing protein [Streptomyces sp. NPDC058268]|uniref:DUF6907 domain-containing protein n=1 Tax=Streptomyces sp. NPDC058268 TaxID=3346413 RepID=UPI0036E146A9
MLRSSEPSQTPALASDSPADAPPRLRPALVNGLPAAAQCPPWCTARHYGTANPLDLGHYGGLLDLEMPRTAGDPVLLAYARLTEEVGAPAHLFVENGLEGAEMGRREAAEFVRGLRVFADQVEAAARQLA